jgi:hypothetical protein
MKLRLVFELEPTPQGKTRYTAQFNDLGRPGTAVDLDTARRALREILADMDRRAEEPTEVPTASPSTNRRSSSWLESLRANASDDAALN